jgi:hypothetical protein
LATSSAAIVTWNCGSLAEPFTFTGTTTAVRGTILPGAQRLHPLGVDIDRAREVERPIETDATVQMKSAERRLDVER